MKFDNFKQQKHGTSISIERPQFICPLTPSYRQHRLFPLLLRTLYRSPHPFHSTPRKPLHLLLQYGEPAVEHQLSEPVRNRGVGMFVLAGKVSGRRFALAPHVHNVLVLLLRRAEETHLQLCFQKSGVICRHHRDRNRELFPHSDDRRESVPVGGDGSFVDGQRNVPRPRELPRAVVVHAVAREFENPKEPIRRFGDETPVVEQCG